MDRFEQVWAGIDAGKGHHHVVAIDAEGNRLLSRRVANNEPDLLAVVQVLLGRSQEVTWAIDLADGPAALMIALLLGLGQRVVYLPGIVVNRATAGYRGEGKTDAKDALIIADQARMRGDLRVLQVQEQSIVELRVLTAHRADVTADRTKTINRLRSLLVSIFPSLEAVPDFTNRGPLILISGFQTPAAIRAMGAAELEGWLRSHKVRGADKLAASAMSAAESQRVRVAGEEVTAILIARLAGSVLELDAQLSDVDKLIGDRFNSHRHAEIIASMVGIGQLLGAEFLAATGGNMKAFASPDHLAGYAGLAPAPRDSGRRTGNLHRPKRYNRQLQRVFYTSALISIQRSPSSKAFYDRKRTEGKRHEQAVLALARRRVNVIWAMLRDQRTYAEPAQASAAAA